MGLFDKFIPKEVKETLDQVKGTLDKIFADPETTKDMDIVLSAVIPLFDAASKNPATENGLKETFNDVAAVLPFFRETLREKKVAIMKAVPLISTFNRLGGPGLKKVFEDQGPEISDINSNLLANSDFQSALERILKRPIGRELFDLTEANGKNSAQEKLTGSGLKFPLAQDNYNRVKAHWDADGGKPQGPTGPGPGPGV
jgi:hypothetical protein